MKVLHLPTAVGGMSWGLAQAEQKLGLESQVLLTTSNKFGYPGDIYLDLETSGMLKRFATLCKTFLQHRSAHDVFHFNFGSSLLDFPNYGLNLLDLPLYPRNAKLVMTYNGCDARQKFQTTAMNPFSACHDSSCYGGICNDGSQDTLKQKRINRVAQHADHIFAVNPDLLWNLPKDKSSFLPYAISSWYSLTTEPLNLNSRLRIVHAPTNRAAKGSQYILQALDNLTQKHPHVEVILVEGLTNSEALNIYKSAHLIVDQVLVGWYGGLAVEAMRMGKPVAAFIREEDLVFIPKEMAVDLKSAVINISPDDIEQKLLPYVENPQLLSVVREASLDYANKWHDPIKVALATKEVYET